MREITIHRRCGISTMPVDAVLASEGSWMGLIATSSIPDVSEEPGLTDMVKVQTFKSGRSARRSATETR
jgi:hypothetical protein